MARLMPPLKYQPLDDEGAIIPGGKLYTYIAGTSTKLTTYTDESGDVSNANPVILDAAGRADVWLGARIYKMILKDADDALIYSQDNVDGSEAESNETSPWAEHAFMAAQSATSLAGETLDLADFKGAIYDVLIERSTSRWTGQLVLQEVSGTGQVRVGLLVGDDSDHGLTFSVSQTLTVVQLKLAVNAGSNGTVYLARRVIPVT